jgi:hypothetical protein
MHQIPFRAILYSAKIFINGEVKDPEASGYKILNYAGHIYVPTRYVAEAMNTAVNFDEKTTTITLDNRFDIISPASNELRAGNLKATNEGNHSKFDLELKIE